MNTDKTRLFKNYRWLPAIFRVITYLATILPEAVRVKSEVPSGRTWAGRSIRRLALRGLMFLCRKRRSPSTRVRDASYVWCSREGRASLKRTWVAPAGMAIWFASASPRMEPEVRTKVAIAGFGGAGVGGGGMGWVLRATLGWAGLGDGCLNKNQVTPIASARVAAKAKTRSGNDRWGGTQPVMSWDNCRL